MNKIRRKRSSPDVKVSSSWYHPAPDAPPLPPSKNNSNAEPPPSSSSSLPPLYARFAKRPVSSSTATSSSHNRTSKNIVSSPMPLGGRSGVETSTRHSRTSLASEGSGYRRLSRSSVSLTTGRSSVEGRDLENASATTPGYGVRDNYKQERGREERREREREERRDRERDREERRERERERTVRRSERSSQSATVRGRSVDVRLRQKSLPTPISSNPSSVSPSRKQKQQPSSSAMSKSYFITDRDERNEIKSKKSLPSPSNSPPRSPRLLRPKTKEQREKEVRPKESREQREQREKEVRWEREREQQREQRRQSLEKAEINQGVRPFASDLERSFGYRKLPTPPEPSTTSNQPQPQARTTSQLQSQSQSQAQSQLRTQSQRPLPQVNIQPHARTSSLRHKPKQVFHQGQGQGQGQAQTESVSTPITPAIPNPHIYTDRDTSGRKSKVAPIPGSALLPPFNADVNVNVNFDPSTSVNSSANVDINLPQPPNNPQATVHRNTTAPSVAVNAARKNVNGHETLINDDGMSTLPIRSKKDSNILTSHSPLYERDLRGTTSSEFTAAHDHKSSKATKELRYRDGNQDRDTVPNPNTSNVDIDDYDPYAYTSYPKSKMMENPQPPTVSAQVPQPYPHGPVRGKPLIFAAMVSEEPEPPSFAHLSQSSNSKSHSNSYGYPSPPLEPVTVSEDAPATPDMLFSPDAVSKRLDVNDHAEEHRGRLIKTPSSAESGSHHPHKLHKQHAASSSHSVISGVTAVHTKPGMIDTNFENGTLVNGNGNVSGSWEPEIERPDTPPSPPPKTSSLRVGSQSELRVGGGSSAQKVDLRRKGHEPAESARLVEGSEGIRQNILDGEQLSRRDIKDADVQAKPPTPPISPEDYSHSRSRRRGQKLERAPPPAVAEVISKIDLQATKSQNDEPPAPEPQMPYPLVHHLCEPSLVAPLLEHLNFYDWCNLSSTSKVIRKMFQRNKELKEHVLERYLGTVGYARWIWDEEEPLNLSFKDMHAYMQGVSMPTHQYGQMAHKYLQSPQDHIDIIGTLAMCTRSYNRVVLRLRAQAEVMERYSRLNGSSTTLQKAMDVRSASQHSRAATSKSRTPSRPPSPNSFLHPQSNQYSRSASQTRSSSQTRPNLNAIQLSSSGSSTVSPTNDQGTSTFQSPLYRIRRAPLLYVFVPSREGEWLSDTSVLECEAELRRAGITHLLRQGDVVWDTAVGDEGNVGRMVWDGSYLIDLDYTFSMSGELPRYLHSLAFPPSYFHRVIRSVTNPICYVDISPWGEEIAANLQLLQDRVKTETPQGSYHTVVRWVHRSSFVIKPPSIKLRIPDTELFVDRGWFGTVVVEAEGTNEGLADLQGRCRDAFPPRAGSQKKGSPSRVFRILRERSRPGEIWIRAVREKERLM